MSLIHLARQGFITKSALPNVTRQRGTTTGTANLMLYGAGKDFAIGTNTTFTDSSSNNFTVTRNGDTIQATNNPFTGSVYFDGNGDYLSVGANAGFNFGTGDFTCEFFIYINENSSPDPDGNRSATILAVGTTSFTLGIAGSASSTGTAVYIYNFPSGGISGSATIPQKAWVHIAVSRSGTNLRFFVNGTQAGSTITNSASYGSSTNTVYIGGNPFNGSYTQYFNGYITNLRVVKGTAVYTANFTVPTSPLTAITNTQLLLLTAQQAPFRDSSANNFTVTANGNAAGSGLEPFPVNYAGSGYFDGTGDYLSVANSTNLDLPADFTVEAWIYLTSTANNQNTIIGKWDTNSYAWLLNANPSTGALGFSIGNSGAYVTGINFGTSITANTWHHVAAIRTGSTIRAFVNGTQVGSDQTNTSNLTATATTFIGKDDSALRNFNGYISNVRVIKGTALYTAAFTPPAAPLTAVTNTQLLLLTNNVGPFVDTSANGFPILRNGDAVQTGFSPFTNQPSAGSGYFDGTGDYLSIPSNAAFTLDGSFTVEAFIYITSTPSLDGDFKARGCIAAYIQNGSTSGFELFVDLTDNKISFFRNQSGIGIGASFTFSLNRWYHVAVTYNGTTGAIYVDGTSITLGTNNWGWVAPSSPNLRVGGLVQTSYNHYFVGYISNLRVIKGTALYTSNFTPATAPLPAVPNTSLLLNTDNYTIANSTPTYLPVTVNGNTTISTAQYPTGMNRSIYFDGNGDYLVCANAALNFNSSNYTVEGYVYIDRTTYSSFDLIGNGFFSDFLTNSYSRWIVLVDTNQKLQFAEQDALGGNSVSITDTVNFPLKQWVHVAAVKSGTTMYLFKDGVLVNTATSSVRTNFGGSINVGQATVDTNYRGYLLGYVSNVRLTKGSTLYTANFTPPAAPLPLSVTVPAFVTNNIYGVYQLA